MVGGLGVGENDGDFGVFDEEADAAGHAEEGADAEGLLELAFLIAEEGEGEVVALGEAFLGFWGVSADADDGDAEVFEGFDAVAE